MMIQAVMSGAGGKLIPIKGTLWCTLGIYWIGLRQSNGYAAIDRGSGYLICKKKTFAECSAFIAENAKRIVEIQETKSYRAQMLKIESALAKIKEGAQDGTDNKESK